jgi:hypothetical protein
MKRILATLILFLCLGIFAADLPIMPPLSSSMTNKIVNTNQVKKSSVVKSMLVPSGSISLKWMTTNSDYYQIFKSTNLTGTWSLYGNYTNTNSVVISTTVSSISFFKVYAHTDEITNHVVTVGWDANQEANVTGYNVYYGVLSRTYTNIAFVSGIANTTCTISNLLGNVMYYLAVTATNNIGLESDYSNEVTYLTPTNRALFHVQMPTIFSVNGFKIISGGP